MRVAHNAFVVVADGRKMLFLRNEGDADFPNLVVEKKEVHANPAHRDQASDAAGRSSNSVDRRGGSVEEADFHQLEEDRFAAEVAELLKDRALRNDYNALIVIAPPTVLGELRKQYHKEVEGRLTGEIAKDLTGHPVAEIEKIVAAD